jgi:O-antigen/teichoic acid export membrane protein
VNAAAPRATAGGAGPLARLRGLLATSQSGIRDVLLLLLPQIVIVLTGFLTTVLIARGLGPAALGHYGLVVSVAGLAAAFSDMGIGQTAIRYAARAAAEGRIGEQMAVLRWALRLRVALVLVIAVVLALAAPLIAGRLWHAPALAPLIRLGLMSGVCAALAAVPAVYFQSVRRFGRNATVQIGQALLGLGGVLLVAALGRWSVGALILVSVVTAALGALVFLVMVPRAALLPPRDGAVPMPRHRFWTAPIEPAPALSGVVDGGPGAFAMYNMISTIIVIILLRLDVWLIGVFGRPEQVGLYTVASRFALPLALLLAAVSGALWPRASARRDPHEALALLRRTFYLSLPLGALAVLYAFVVPLLTPWLFGSAYKDSRLLAQVLCIRFAFAILIVPVGVIGYSLGLVRVYWVINLVQLIVVAAIDVALIPRIGPMAAALALVVSEILGVTLAGAVLVRRARQIAREPRGGNAAGAPA